MDVSLQPVTLNCQHA